MKNLMIVLTLLVSSVSFAQLHNNSAPCESEALAFYEEKGQPSDQPKEITHSHVQTGGLPLYDTHHRELKTYPTDTVIYVGAGSYHSGYFQDLIVVDLATCQGLDIYNIYSE